MHTTSYTQHFWLMRCTNELSACSETVQDQGAEKQTLPCGDSSGKKRLEQNRAVQRGCLLLGDANQELLE